MNNFDALSYVWSDDVVRDMKALNETIFSEAIDNKYEHVKLAFLRQMVCSKRPVPNAIFSEVLAEDFKFYFEACYEHHLFKWVAQINFADEICQTPDILYSEVTPKFNATKFYNLLQTIEFGEIINNFTVNLALFTELIYYQQFFEPMEVKKWTYLIGLLYKKLCIFALVWVEKRKAMENSPLMKKLAEVVVSVKIYSILLSLPITTSRKLFSYFEMISERMVETRYEKLIVKNQYYLSLRNYLYKNMIINMYDYQTAVTHNLRVKEVSENFTLGELSDMLYNDYSDVFKDATLYERLDSGGKASLTSDEDLYLNASKWFSDLTKAQKKNLLPYMTLNRGGKDVTITVRRDNSWFVNGGERSERQDEWAIWRRYVTCLTVEYLQSIEQNGVEVEVIIVFYFILFRMHTDELDFNYLQTQILNPAFDFDDSLFTDQLEPNVDIEYDYSALECHETNHPAVSVEDISASTNVEILDEADVMLSASVQERNVFACKKKEPCRKKKAAERSAKAHKELAAKLNGVYHSLPTTFILHKSFVKVSKVQKLDQIEKFLEHIRRHGYLPDQQTMSKKIC